ncbi:hypothetical protein BJ508DRAFT_366766 [Ascobolus immersus RN42]|uniref:Uncharacterized protein n=1 Tax=Ascobolus immersus RN42 TaxID=1160509 RepID=A0A3N4HHB3_ASCIM|nr:hypothetical protein BJ508DRAFT_366766 [Ascobolus immersus RN42]
MPTISKLSFWCSWSPLRRLRIGISSKFRFNTIGTQRQQIHEITTISSFPGFAMDSEEEVLCGKRRQTFGDCGETIPFAILIAKPDSQLHDNQSTEGTELKTISVYTKVIGGITSESISDAIKSVFTVDTVPCCDNCKKVVEVKHPTTQELIKGEWLDVGREIIKTGTGHQMGTEQAPSSSEPSSVLQPSLPSHDSDPTSGSATDLAPFTPPQKSFADLLTGLKTRPDEAPAVWLKENDLTPSTLLKQYIPQRNDFRKVFRVKNGKVDPLFVEINGISIPTCSIHCAIANILTLTTESKDSKNRSGSRLATCALLGRLTKVISYSAPTLVNVMYWGSNSGENGNEASGREKVFREMLENSEKIRKEILARSSSDHSDPASSIRVGGAFGTTRPNSEGNPDYRRYSLQMLEIREAWFRAQIQGLPPIAPMRQAAMETEEKEKRKLLDSKKSNGYGWENKTGGLESNAGAGSRVWDRRGSEERIEGGHQRNGGYSFGGSARSRPFARSSTHSTSSWNARSPAYTAKNWRGGASGIGSNGAVKGRGGIAFDVRNPEELGSVDEDGKIATVPEWRRKY